jgi:hypothetical protein
VKRPGPKPHPWHVLSEAALAFANADTEVEIRRASWRLAKAAVRYRDERAPRGRPSADPCGREREQRP